MKNSSTFLFHLIKSLNNSEKRYFTLYSRRHYAHDNQYLSLYQLIDKQHEYNEPQAIKETGWSRNHYAVQKNILYSQILAALIQYDTESNPVQKLQQGVFACQKLVQKGLSELAKAKLLQLQRDAAEYEIHEVSLQLKQIEIQLYGRVQYKQVTTAQLDQWYEEVQAITDKINTEAYYKYTNSRAQKLQLDAGGRSAKAAKEMKALMSEKESAKYGAHPTQKAQMDQLQTQALYHFMDQDTVGAMVINSDFLSLMESQRHWIQFYPERYFSALNNYLIDCFILKKEKELQDGVVKMRALQTHTAFKKTANLEVNIFRTTYQLELNYLISTGRFAKAKEILPAVMSGLEKYAGKLPIHHQMNLQYLCAYVLFGNAQYGKASTMLDTLQQSNRNDTATLLDNVSALMQAVCHYEMKNYSIIDSLSKSCKRKLNSQKPAINAEQEFELLNMLSQFAVKEPQQLQWSKAWDKITVKGAERQTTYSGYFDFFTYIYAKANSINFEQAWLQLSAR